MYFLKPKEYLCVENILFSSFSIAYTMQIFWFLPINTMLMHVCAGIVGFVVFLTFPLINMRYRISEIPSSLFFVVILLAVMYGARLGLPDRSFDVLTTRIMIWERGLIGAPFTGPENVIASFSSMLGELMHGIFFRALGYRLGTVINVFAVIWLLKETYSLLFILTQSKNYSVLGTAFAVLGVENILFQINTYMLDLLGIPFFFYALRITLTRKKFEMLDLFFISLIYGISFSLKWTNAVMIAPSICLVFYHIYMQKNLWPIWGKLCCLILLGSILASLPSALYLYTLTNSPFFPIYNTFFRSPLFPLSDFRDLRWGPMSLIEAIIWPITASFHATRISELPRYSGRLFLGCVALLPIALIKWPNETLYKLSFIFFVGVFGWSFSTGYIRYAIILDVIAGILLVALLHFFYEAMISKTNEIIMRIKQYVGYVLFSIMLAQFALGWTNGALTNWSTHSWPSSYFVGYSEIFRDHKLENYLQEYERRILKKIDGLWLLPSQPFNAYMFLLRPNFPFISNIYRTEHGSQLINKHIYNNKNENFYSLCEIGNLDATLAMWSERGILPIRLSHFEMPWFAHSSFRQFVLIEAQYNPEEYVTRTNVQKTVLDSFYNAKIEIITPKHNFIAGEKSRLVARIKNISDQIWHHRTNNIQLFLGNHWFNETGEYMIHSEHGRVPLLHDILPGNYAIVPITITAPDSPGLYVLKFDLVLDVWFASKGSLPRSMIVQVESLNINDDERILDFALDRTYMNFAKFPMPVKFGSYGNDSNFIMNGFSGPESGFRWTSGSKAVLRFWAHDVPDNLTASFDLFPLLREGVLNAQRVEVFVNENKVADWELTGPTVKEIALSRSLVRNQQFEITFLLPDAASPKDLGINDDPRKLAVAFRAIQFSEE